MPKSTLQKRAEKAAAEFRASRRPPIVVEFAGLPKAGKTSTLNQVYSFLRRCGFKCEVVVERASVCPIRDKRHFNFNIWTACTSISQLLEKTQNPPRVDDPDILFLDRGIFDSLCWFSLLRKLVRIKEEDEKKVSQFLLIDDWTSKLTGVIAMTAKPKDAMKREQGYLHVDGLQGSIMNPTVLKEMDSVIKEKTSEYENTFYIYNINTSSKAFLDKAKETCEAVTKKILTWVEEVNEENILSAPKDVLSGLDNNFVLDKKGAEEIVKIFESHGDFKPRQRVEKDDTRIQPLPVVVVRNKSGDILQLIRRERDPKNKLHKKVAVWAGGHVRREDSILGHSILTGAVRELQEELRLYIKSEALQLLGAVYVSTDSGSTKKHLAIVYEWNAPNDDVEITLCKSEFFERGGTSLTGEFVSPDKLSPTANDLEEWSKSILTGLLQTKQPA